MGKKNLLLSLTLAVFMVGLLFFPTSAAPDKIVVFPDPALNQVIHDALGFDISEEIHQSDLETLTYLDGIVGSIQDLTGLNYVTNLTYLELSLNGGINDISPLSSLTKLQHLGLFMTGVSDLRPLQNLTQLRYLSLVACIVTDIRPLSRLDNLEILYLGNNFITDIRPLVKNKGLGAGDKIVLIYNQLDTTPGSRTMAYIEILINRGADLLYLPYVYP